MAAGKGRQMTTEMEGLTDIATGALVARAVDGRKGAHSGGDHETGKCLNCQTELTGAYCHACGQSAHTHRTLLGFGHDILHGVFHFEGRVWHTIPMLILRPGELTRRYINGERVRFISPVALFLFMVFLTFAVLNFGPGADVTAKLDTAALNTKIADAEEQRQTLEFSRKALIAQGQPTKAIDGQLSINKKTLETLHSAQTADHGALTREMLGQVHTDIEPLNKILHKLAENPSLFFYKLQSSAYKFLWLLIPISLPFIWLMFAWRRDVALYDHAVFATYSLSAMMLLMVVLHLMSLIGVPDAVYVWSLILVPPFHMYRQLRGTYGVSRFGGLWRVAFLLLAAGISSLIFALLLIEMLVAH